MHTTHSSRLAFTITELLVGLTLIVILATIAFISLSNYNTQARDSARLTDVRNITSILNLNYTQKRVYPTPTDGIDVTFSGATVWTQGVFWQASAQETGKLFWELRDPKYGNHYSYSVTSNKKEYQLGVLFEQSGNTKWQITAQLSLPELWVSQAYASDPFSPSELNPIIWLDAEDVNWNGNKSNNPGNNSTFSLWVNKWTLGSSGNPTVTHGNLRYTTSGFGGNKNSVFLDQNGWLRLNGSAITQGDIFQVIQNRDPFWPTDRNGRWLQSANNDNYTIGYHSTRRNSLRIANSPNKLTWSPATTSGRMNPFIYGFHSDGVNYSFRESGNIISQGATSSIAWQTWAFNRAGKRSNDRSDLVVWEILIFNQALSEQDRQKVEGYLAHKWGMTGSLASSHPYKNTPPSSTPSVPPNSTPEAFTFNSMTDIVPDTLYTSNAIRVQGINIPADISVVWGEYSIDEGVFTSDSWMVTVWQSVRVRRVSSSTYWETASVTLTIGGVSGLFTLTTIEADTLPDNFSFTAISEAELWAQYYSEDITVTGINIPVSISLSGSEAEYRVSGWLPQNVAQGGVATASSQENTSNSPDRAFDGDTGTSWWGNNNQMPAWLQYDFWGGNPQRLTRYTLYRSSNQFSWWNWNWYSPRNWTFEGSNDGSSWTVLDTQTNQVIATNATKREFAFANNQYYRYYRINITSNNHWGSNWVNITEMELISEGNGIFTSSPGVVEAWDIVTVRMNASSTPGTTHTTTLSVWDGSADFSITTLGPITTPDSFSFTDVFDASISTMYESNAITVTGINTASPISISGWGEYRINGWSYTSAAWVVNPFDIVQVRRLSPEFFFSSTSTTLTIWWVSASYNISTPAPPPDTTPDDFSFFDITDASLATEYVSESITISGINAASQVTISGWEYRIDAWAFTSASGNIENGQTIQLRATSWPNPGHTRNVTLTIGWVSDTWSISTIAPDTTPDSFSLNPITEAQLATMYESDTITITGINTATSVTITGWEYRINSGAWRSSSWEVYNGDTLQVRRLSSSSGNTSTSATLTVGWASPQTFTVTTLTPDTDVDPFVFQRITDAFFSIPTASDTITISGINIPVPISVSWGEYRIGTTWSFTSAAGTISNGDLLTLRLTSWNGPNVSTTMSVDVGGYTTEFIVQTRSNIVWVQNTSLPDSQVQVYGNYNGLFAHAQDGDIYYIVATPSILSYDLSNPDIEHILAEKKLVYGWFLNIPESYKDHFEVVDEVPQWGTLENLSLIGGKDIVLNGGFDFSAEAPLLFAWERKDLAAYSGLKQIHEWVRLNYRNFIAYPNVSAYLDDYKLGYIEDILSRFVWINPIKPYYCSDILDYKLIENIAPEATITASSAWFWSTALGIANGIISSEWALDYEYHSADTNASIFFEWTTPQRIGFVKIYNRTWCCSERLSGANIKLYNELWEVIYSHPLWNTQGEYVIDLDLEGIGQMHFAKSLSIESVNNNYINLREVEIYLGGELRSWFYKVDRDGRGGLSPYNVYCDMETDGGWWTRIWDNFITNGQMRNQTHVWQHTFTGYSDFSDNVILAQETETPPAQIPDASVLRHNWDASESYQMFFDSIPWEYFAQEIRLRAWVKGTSSSVFHNRIEYANGTVSTTQPEWEVLDTSDGWWRLEQVRIPLTGWLVDNFYWNAGQWVAWPFFMTGFGMEVYYK